jgi:transposase-like protein
MTTPEKRRRPGKIAGDLSQTVKELPAACASEPLAVEFMERLRWGDCPCCPRCGDTQVRKMLDASGERNKRFLWKCFGCKKQYTVRINSVYEDSRIPMRHWVFAFWSACTHKKGVSALQIKRQTGLNYRSALFMMNRIRHAMTPPPDPKPPLGGTVEVDEVYIGPPNKKDVRWDNKTPVIAVVQRGTGEVRTKVANVTSKNLCDFVQRHTAPGSRVITDAHKFYRKAVPKDRGHDTIKHHIKQYVDPEDPTIHTNTVEGFFSLLRRRLDGTHHGVSEEHLFRYCHEAEFLYTFRKMDDGERTQTAIRCGNGKRLTYKESKLCG